jgi:hypothetical protein
MTPWQYIAATCATLALVGCSTDEEVTLPTDPGRYFAMVEREGESRLLVRQVFNDGQIFEDSGPLGRLGISTLTVNLDTCGEALLESKSQQADRRMLLREAQRKSGCLLSDNAFYTVLK